MKFLVVFAALVVASQASSKFSYIPYGKGCSYPNWECDCKVVYNCDGDSGFPNIKEDDDSRVSGCIKDLAPDDYPLRISGKRWRREIWGQEEFCRRECFNRLNAFLCLDADNVFSPYSHRAICLKLLDLDPRVDSTGAGGPFYAITATGNVQPCCEVWLQWGLNWCPQKWTKLLGGTRCHSDAASAGNFPSSTSVFSSIFSAHSCAAGEGSDDWCIAANLPILCQ